MPVRSWWCLANVITQSFANVIQTLESFSFLLWTFGCSFSRVVSVSLESLSFFPMAELMCGGFLGLFVCLFVVYILIVKQCKYFY